MYKKCDHFIKDNNKSLAICVSKLSEKATGKNFLNQQGESR